MRVSRRHYVTIDDKTMDIVVFEDIDKCLRFTYLHVGDQWTGVE